MKVLVGDIFASEAQTLVNAVNCVGVMGKGIALAFKQRFPMMYSDYVARCVRSDVILGQPYLFRQTNAPWILNFPTKHHWRARSQVAEIVAGLEYLKAHYHVWELISLAVPALGCGAGQLAWREVGPILYTHLAQLNIPVELYAPPGTPEAELGDSFLLHREGGN